ncbi:UDP-glucose dehydrogenase/UDP-mannac dehydrogenase, putative [Paecilomyces variotii No. 5]|uniref:UDP-glucose dehydrogenase/UDP-mannac dehydrogenase, putative n=1 Tax=Byssochlamys spectabilis (strain No. 5 / NBRC 109023) TaxID=1356009 RepID=V5G5N7_BYSSN|nr:UDP-glucose dehydrogenase/UDP-mannac dehydrogenase, putative [Paecilomyces variotii No. 5]
MGFMRSNTGLPTPPPNANFEKEDEYFFDVPIIEVTPPRQGHRTVVAVIGVGYIGFQLATAFGRVHEVIAFDVDQRRLKDIEPLMANLKVHCTTKPEELAIATHFLISVPTRLHHDNTVDTQHLRSAIDLVAQYARPGSTVVIESSVAVGMSRDLLKDVMLLKGLKAGMSPERVDPGRTDPPLEHIPKVISGLDDIVPGSLSSIQELYQEVFQTLVPVSSPEVAEMTKLYENCQRMVCIAHANEMADACNTLGINAHEVSAAAATKPFGYMPYSPGLGVGGHCIPVNPYYLLSNCDFPLLKEASERMETRPATLGDRVMRRYLTSRKASWTPPKSDRTRVLVVGVGFKRGQSVLSNSPGLSLIRHLLDEWEAYVEFVDPLVTEEAVSYVPRLDEKEHWNKESLEDQFDIVIVAVNQVGLDMDLLRNLDGVLVENFTAS